MVFLISPVLQSIVSIQANNLLYHIFANYRIVMTGVFLNVCTIRMIAE